MILDETALQATSYSTRAARWLHGRAPRALVFVAAMALIGTARGQDEAVRVTVRPLSDVAVTLSESAPATVVELNHARVASQLAGVVDSIEVEVGERAGAGDVLATLDCTEYRQTLARAEAQLDALEARRRLAEEQLKRALKLLPTRNISEEQVNQRRAEADAASAELVAQRAQIAIAGRQVEYCRIESPYDGIVTQRHASRGDFVSPGSPIADILDTRAVEVSTRLPLDAVSRIDGQRLVFRSGQDEYPVRLRTMLPMVDASSRSREARLQFTGEPALAGTPGRLAWESDTPAIPAYLLVERGEGRGVFVADDGRARFVVLPGALAGRPAQTDLDTQTPIVTEGRHRLEPGIAIEIVDD